LFLKSSCFGQQWQWDQANRQDRELAARLALVNEAKARYEDALLAHEAEVRGLVNDWQSGTARLARQRDALLPTLQQRGEAALTAYRSGKGDLASVLAARRDELDARVQVLALELEPSQAGKGMKRPTGCQP
jgi:outer membrane protein TolC